MDSIYFRETKNRKEFTINALNKIKEELKRAKKILLKPNIVSFENYPATTHPEVLETCLQFLLNLKKEVLVADGSAPDAGNSKKIIEGHILKRVCDKFQVPLIDLSSGPTKKMKTKSFEFNFSTIPFEYDYIISLPILKSHDCCGITGALKNQFGLIAPRDRITLHTVPWKNIHKAIAEINLVVKPNFWIMDAVQTIITTNEIRHGGKLKDLGYMLAGKDPVALDIEGLKLLQKVAPDLKDKKPEDILHLKYAIELNVGQREYSVNSL